MSSFFLTVRHKETGQLHEALALDDAFGRREYGYSISNIVPCMRESEFFSQYERIEKPQANTPPILDIGSSPAPCTCGTSFSYVTYDFEEKLGFIKCHGCGFEGPRCLPYRNMVKQWDEAQEAKQCGKA